MSISATLSWKGLDKKAILANLEAQQVKALKEALPVFRETLLATVGTQYYSLNQLKRAGYPYKIGSKPPMPPGVVNKQSGRFYASIRVVGPTKIGNRIVIQIYSTDETRAWQLGGTDREIQRPYKALLQSRLRQQMLRKVSSVSRSLIKIKVAA